MELTILSLGHDIKHALGKAILKILSHLFVELSHIAKHVLAHINTIELKGALNIQ